MYYLTKLFIYNFSPVLLFCSYTSTSCSYEEALQTLADSEAKRETVDKELRLVSIRQQKQSSCDVISDLKTLIVVCCCKKIYIISEEVM